MTGDELKNILQEHPYEIEMLNNMDQIDGKEGIGDHMNTSELEAIAICYDNIRSLRKKMPNNDDYELG